MCPQDEDLNCLGSLIKKSISDALNSPISIREVNPKLLRKLAERQGLHKYAASALREIKLRESRNETCWVSVSGSNLSVYGEHVFVDSSVWPILNIESFSGPGTLITSVLSDEDAKYLLQIE